MARKTSKGSGKKRTARSKSAKVKRPAPKTVSRKSAAKKKTAPPKPVVRPAARRPVKNRAAVTRMPGARPAPHAGAHRGSALPGNIYERDLDKNAANYATLT